MAEQIHDIAMNYEDNQQNFEDQVTFNIPLLLSIPIYFATISDIISSIAFVN